MSLSGASALVTGASGGIGGAIARRLASEGVDLILAGRDRDRLDDAANAIRSAGGRAEVSVGDLTQTGDLAALLAFLERRDGVDLLIHCLGAYHAATVEETPVAALDRQLDVNLRAPWELTRRLLPALRRRRGQIVFVNSTVGVSAKAGVGAYSAAKHGLRALADALRDEVNPDGVRVLTVYPGRTASEMQREVRRLEGEPYRPERLVQPDDVAEMVVAALVLSRTAEVTEMTIRPMKKP